MPVLSAFLSHDVFTVVSGRHMQRKEDGVQGALCPPSLDLGCSPCAAQGSLSVSLN